MSILKHYELVTYFVPLMGSLSGARKSCFQFWQTSNSPPLRSLIITIPIIVTTEYLVCLKYQIGPRQMPSNCLSNTSPANSSWEIFQEYFENIATFILRRGMKPLHWRPSHSTFHLLNWSLERSFGGYLVQICSGWGREGEEVPWSGSSISIPATSSWWWGRGAVGERGVALTKKQMGANWLLRTTNCYNQCC